MTPDRPYNPLDKVNLAQSIANALLETPAVPLAQLDAFDGAGVYVIYYKGDFAPYSPMKVANAVTPTLPIYVGKAIPRGGRKGGLSADASVGRALFPRLSKHAASISSCNNLDIADFMVRFLIVDDIWIPLGENMLIEEFKPLWNRVIDGFGNNDPGGRRANQYRSPWDVLHPGRPWAEKLADNPVSIADLEKNISDYFAGTAILTVDSREDEVPSDNGDDG